MQLPLACCTTRSPVERSGSICDVGNRQILRHTAANRVGSEINRIAPVRPSVGSQRAVLTQTCHILRVGCKDSVAYMVAPCHIVSDPCRVRNTLIFQLGMSTVILTPSESGRHIGYKTDKKTLGDHAMVIEVEHQAVYSQEVDTARQKGLGQETEITSRVVVGGKVNGKTRHRVGRAIRNCQHSVQRGEIADRVCRILADTDNQIRVQRRVIARFSGAERHLHVVYRQRRVERILQHSPCLAGAIQVEDTCKVSAIDII